MTPFERAVQLRTSNNVKRLHTVKILHENTVGHHSANVAILCDILTNGKASANLLRAALYHDSPEYYTGDIPAQVKWRSRELVAILNDMEDRFISEVFGGSGIGFHLTEAEQRILKEADIIDLMLYCLEERSMGNMITNGVFRRVREYLVHNNVLSDMANELVAEITHNFNEMTANDPITLF